MEWHDERSSVQWRSWIQISDKSNPQLMHQMENKQTGSYWLAERRWLWAIDSDLE